MFAKLALRNVRRSVKDYSIYFLTLMFGVCVFYVFNSLRGQPVMQLLQLSQSYMVEGILIYMGVLSVFVAVVLAGLILYANNFMLKRRKKELATYLLLGLPQHKLALMLFLETLAIGLLALCAGVGLGILAAHGLSQLMIVLFALPYSDLHFQFQWDAVGYTALCFGAMFLVVMLFNQISVARQRLSELMTAGRKNEVLRQRPVGFSVVVFLVGLVFIAAAYFLLLSRGLLHIDPLWFGMLALGSVGTVFFFRGLSGFVLQLCRKNENLYYKGLNMFVLRQWSGKIHSTYLSMTVVCLLLLLAIGATACTIGMNDAVVKTTDASVPYDLTVNNRNWEENGLKQTDIESLLRAGGFDVDGLAGYTQYLVYQREDGSAALSRSDYNALMALQGKPALGERDVPAVEDELIYNSWGNGNYYIQVDQDTFERGYWVLEDDAVRDLPLWEQYFVGNYPARADVLAWDGALKASLSAVEEENLYLYTDLRQDFYLEQLGTKVLVLFIGVYLGIVFLMTAAAVLALQQLSQAADNVQQYGILRQLGAEEGMRTKALFFQVFLAFFLPLALGVVHAAVGMTAANAVIYEVSRGNLDTVASSFVTAGLILLIYGAYFLLTFLSSRRILRERV